MDGDRRYKWIQLVSGLHVSGVNAALNTCSKTALEVVLAPSLFNVGGTINRGADGAARSNAEGVRIEAPRGVEIFRLRISKCQHLGIRLYY